MKKIEIIYKQNLKYYKGFNAYNDFKSTMQIIYIKYK